jgi:predicted NBD/HSP70 family sugar kinase
VAPRPSETSSERCVLAALIAAPPEGLTRAELQEQTGLSPATLVTHLKKAGPSGEAPGRLVDLVEVTEDDDSGLARYQLRSDAAYTLGLDLGCHHIRTGVGDALGNIVHHPDGSGRWEERDDAVDVNNDPWFALDRAADLAAKLITDVERRGNVKRTQFIGIGVSVTSAIEPDTGMFRANWASDAWEGLRVVRELKERLERRGLTCPLVLDKDANHGAIGYSRSSDGRNAKNFVFVKWAQGLSAGLMLDGRLQHGTGGSAGAFGHSPVVHVLDKDDDEVAPSALWGPDTNIRCRRCNKQDCLEAMIGTERLRRVVAEKRDAFYSDDASQWPTFQAIQEAALDDPSGVESEVLRAAAKRLGNALGTIANLLNPQLVIVGGLFSRQHGDLLNNRIRKGLRDVATAPAYRDLDVKFTDLGIIEGTIASVITSGRLASFLLASQPKINKD